MQPHNHGPGHVPTANMPSSQQQQMGCVVTGYKALQLTAKSATKRRK